MRLKELFTVPEGQRVTEAALRRVLISSICSILLCMGCLIGTTWALFEVGIENKGNVIQIGEPGIIMTVDGKSFVSGTELPAGTHEVHIVHANELDDLQRKSTLYVTLMLSGDSGTASTYSVGSNPAAYAVTLSQENQYEAKITITAETAFTLGYEESWFEPDNADEVIDDEIWLPAEPEPVPLITNEEFLYGSYFDHDSFDGNTGTRITSGDYGLIRSADALLPAQDITIRVTDTDLSQYNVTLGYFTKDGVYTGRNGILPMTDGVLTIKASEMAGGYFRVNVYLYDGNFYKVPESAQIVVYSAEEYVEPEEPSDPAV